MSHPTSVQSHLADPRLTPRLLLRDHLLSSLSALPTPTPLDLTVLISPPRRTQLFPHTGHPPRPALSEILITLSSPLALLSAISAQLYCLPTGDVLYVSKIDSSGQRGVRGSTRTLVVSFLGFFAQSRIRCRVVLFARAQGQYLFANSSRFEGKRPLGGLGLCGWWKGVMEDVARCAVGVGAGDQTKGENQGMNGHDRATHGEAHTRQDQGESSKMAARRVEMSWILPSYEAAEANAMVPSKRPLPADLSWKYAPPWLEPLDRSGSDAPLTLAELIPSLTDDPKTRFLDELVGDVPHIPTRPQKDHDPHSTRAESEKDKKRDRDASQDEAHRRLAFARLSRTTPSEFWTRMGFRQECASGDVTAFFQLDTFGTAPDADLADEKSLLRHTLIERLLTALLNTDFASKELAETGSRIWMDSMRSIVGSELGEEGLKGCVGVVHAKEVAEVAQGKRKEETEVTVLQVRKKKRT